MKVEKVFWKRVMSSIVFALLISVSIFAGQSSTEIKTLFDRYQSLHGQYVEAVRQGAGETKIKSIGNDLKQAYDAYYKALGIEPDYQSTGFPSELPTYDTSDSASGNQALAAEESQTEDEETAEVTKKVSEDRAKFNELLTKLYSSEREENSADLKKNLESFIAERLIS